MKLSFRVVFTHWLKLRGIDSRPLEQFLKRRLQHLTVEAAARFCCAFDELRNYLRPRHTMGEVVSPLEQRRAFLQRLATLQTVIELPQRRPPLQGWRTQPTRNQLEK